MPKKVIFETKLSYEKVGLIFSPDAARDGTPPIDYGGI